MNAGYSTFGFHQVQYRNERNRLLCKEFSDLSITPSLYLIVVQSAVNLYKRG
jgi:hypothetical protein